MRAGTGRALGVRGRQRSYGSVWESMWSRGEGKWDKSQNGTSGVGGGGTGRRASTQTQGPGPRRFCQLIALLALPLVLGAALLIAARDNGAFHLPGTSRSLHWKSRNSRSHSLGHSSSHSHSRRSSLLGGGFWSSLVEGGKGQWAPDDAARGMPLSSGEETGNALTGVAVKPRGGSHSTGAESIRGHPEQLSDKSGAAHASSGSEKDGGSASSAREEGQGSQGKGGGEETGAEKGGTQAGAKEESKGGETPAQPSAGAAQVSGSKDAGGTGSAVPGATGITSAATGSATTSPVTIPASTSTATSTSSAAGAGGGAAKGGSPPPEETPGEDPDVRFKIVIQEELRGALERMRGGAPVVGTISNLAFSDMLRNWFLNVKKAGMAENALVAALDEQTAAFCREHGIPSILLHSNIPSTNFRKNGNIFREFGTMKTAFVLSVLEAGWDLLMSDTDTVWMRNAWGFVSASSPLGAADVMVTSDSVSHENDVESQKHPWRVYVNRDWQGWFRYATPRAREIFGNAYEHAFNTGVLFLRSTPAALRFAAAWHEGMRTKGKSMNLPRLWGDQHAFNQLHRIRMFPIQVYEPPEGTPGAPPVSNRIFWTHNHTVKLAILPVAEFCNGHVFFVQKLHVLNDLKPYVVHNTFQFYYGPGKVARFRHWGLWLLDPPEFYTQGNFLSVDMDLPQHILDIPPGPKKHVAAFQFYYEGLRNAWALALILNRTLIFPKVQCYCDRHWFTLTSPCRSPGVDVDPPFECPIDHFIDVHFWGTDPKTMTHRPSNFLELPEVPDDIKNSRAEIQLVEPRAEAKWSKGETAELPMYASDVQVWRALSHQNFRKIRVLQLSTPHRAFCNFTELYRGQSFDRKSYRKFYMEWCCLPGFKPPEWPKFRNYNISIPPIAHRTYQECVELETHMEDIQIPIAPPPPPRVPPPPPPTP